MFSFIGRVDLFSKSHSRMLYRAWKLAEHRGDDRQDWYAFLYNVSCDLAGAPPVVKHEGAKVISLKEYRESRRTA